MLDPERLREEFPALSRRVGGRPALFFDGPAGSQVPRTVIEAVGRYLAETNANTGGLFATSLESDRLLEAARSAAADLLGASDPALVVFGPNMTSLTFQLALALGQGWREGDEVVLTRLEHDANFTPWIDAAERAGARVREAGIVRDDCTLDLDDLCGKLSTRTRLVAVTAASNAVGSLTPIREIVRSAHEVGALVFVDAVHFAPHRRMDVESWGCDFVACSAYKFFGPHVGILWGRRELLEALPVRRLRVAPAEPPGRWMTGTACHEGIAGVLAAIDYLARIGGEVSGADERRAALDAAFAAIEEHERALGAVMLDVLGRVAGIRVWGIADRARLADRVPTFSFTHARRSPADVARHLAERGIFVWHGNFYAAPLTESLGLEPGGLVRLGLLHYNTTLELERLGEALAEL